MSRRWSVTFETRDDVDADHVLAVFDRSRAPGFVAKYVVAAHGLDTHVAVDDALAAIFKAARKVADSERASGSLIDQMVDSIDIEALGDLESKVSDVVAALHSAVSAGEEWRESERGDDRADARDRYIQACEELANAGDELDPVDYAELDEASLDAAVERSMA